MKRLLIALGMTMILCMSAIIPCFAAVPVGSDTVEEWALKIPSYPNTLAILDGEDGCYYIYPAGQRGIPYVMIYVYEGFSDEASFFDSFTPFLAKKYADLEVMSGVTPVTIDGDEYYEVDYAYTVSDALCNDRRIARNVDGLTYMFASKEIPELDKTVGSLLEETIADCVFLAEGEDVNEPAPEPYPSDIPEINWSDIEPELEAEGIEGSFYYFDEIDARVWIPDYMQAEALTSEDRAAGYIAYFVSEPGSYENSIGVQYMDIGMTPEEHLEVLLSSGMADEIAEYTINDIPFVGYTIPQNDLFVLDTITANGYVLEFLFYPLSSSFISDAIEIIGASIQAA